jgi:hypothetical protein
MKSNIVRFFGITLCLLSAMSLAQIDQPKLITTSERFGDYSVHFNVFNSSSIAPAVASQYKLVRGRNRALVNISLVKHDVHGQTLGLPTQITGSVKNLMQQQQTLNFITIEEGEATYYIAPLVFDNEEILHFSVKLTAENGQPITLNFARQLYWD